MPSSPYSEAYSHWLVASQRSHQATSEPPHQCQKTLVSLTLLGKAREMPMAHCCQDPTAEAIGRCSEPRLLLYNHLISTHEFIISANLAKPPGFLKKFKFATLWETPKVCEMFHKVIEHMFVEHLFPERLFVLSKPNIKC